MKLKNKFNPAECHARNLLTIASTLERNNEGLRFYDREGTVLVVFKTFVREYDCWYDAIVGTRAILDYVSNVW